jgi:UDP-N-acetyl-D-glucosamine/UDP-N-acetyl-D-galactosamine dehydrogenase
MRLTELLYSRQQPLVVIGLGYVGLPIALAFAKKFKVIGFDINESRIGLLNKQIDPSNELIAADFDDCDIIFSFDEAEIKGAACYIVTVPTPIDDNNVPDLTALRMASMTLGRVVKRGAYIIYESTVYPGCTREDCVPIVEKISGLVGGNGFKFGYSPERINPGDKKNTLKKIAKVVAGCDDEALVQVAELYETIIENTVHRAPTIEVAEAAKVIENTQRDLNISFMNELSIIFHRMDIDTHDVLDAARTKWNFLPFEPGLVGGHCISVDPWYLLHRAEKFGYVPQVIHSGRRINDSMPAFVAKELTRKLISHGKNPGECTVLVLGLTFKENVSDIRNSKVFDLITELKEFSITVQAYDPYVTKDMVPDKFKRNVIDMHSTTGIIGMFDAVILAVGHDAFKGWKEEVYEDFFLKPSVLFDLKNLLPHLKPVVNTYWRL